MASGDLAVQAQILGPIYLPHPTRPKRSEDLVRTELTTDAYHQRKFSTSMMSLPRRSNCM